MENYSNFEVFLKCVLKENSTDLDEEKIKLYQSNVFSKLFSLINAVDSIEDFDNFYINQITLTTLNSVLDEIIKENFDDEELVNVSDDDIMHNLIGDIDQLNVDALMNLSYLINTKIEYEKTKAKIIN